MVFGVMFCAVVTVISAAFNFKGSVKLLKSDETIVRHFRNEFSSANDDVLRKRARLQGAALMATDAGEQYLFRVRHELDRGTAAV